MFKGNILITGGSGTLGRSIVQWAQENGRDCTFTIYSRSELRQAEMAAKYPGLRYILGDIRDESQLRAAVVGHDMVIHAAAMKRIPECEAQPAECAQTNITGSLNVVRACIASRVKRCVGISTDKACAAITTYGASKRAMEGFFQRYSGASTVFTAVRYGNVVASNGSVIPLWQRQAREKNPLTLTCSDMTRFWMSRMDAVRLIERSLTKPEGSICVPKMGSLSIKAMASIIAPGAPTIDMGVRSCEKTHEDLIHPDEDATEDGDRHFLIHNTRNSGGIVYNSRTCRALGSTEFLSMLEAAE